MRAKTEPDTGAMEISRPPVLAAVCLAGRAVGVALALLLVAAAPATADGEPCAAALAAAGESFELGVFEEIPGQLAACLGGRSTRAERIQAFTLLARTYLETDEPDKARQAVESLLRLAPGFAPDAPTRLVRLVEEVRRAGRSEQVSTASKTPESRREAPATVWVVTGEEIARRGYHDLAAVLRDLPGLDVSRGNGELYASLSLRGIPSAANDRFLFLVDGVEQNSLGENVAHVSRQYPLAVVDRLEVVYGPMSALYGPNALAGVIQVFTRRPEDVLAKGRRLGVEAQAAHGSLATSYGETALAGQDASGNLAWSLTGRIFRSDEADLSRLPDWDYDDSAVDYRSLLRLEGEAAAEFAGQYTSSLLYRIEEGPGGAPVVELTDRGERLVREIDRRLFVAESVGFSDQTEDLSLSARLRIADLTVGLQHWQEREGVTPWYTDSFLAGEENGSATAPRHTSLYLEYSRPAGGSSWLTLFTRYRNDGFDGHRTSYARLETYAAGRSTLFDLALSCGAEASGESDEISALCLESAFLRRVQLEQSSSELTGEARWVYQPASAWQAVAGFEARRGSIQSDRTSLEEGFATAGPRFDRTALALYGQVGYRLAPALRLVGSGRIDRGEARDATRQDAGFGTVASPRLGLVYTPSAFTFKALYGEAFTLLTKEELAGGEPAKARSFEISAGWRMAPSLELRLSAYRTESDDLRLQAPPHGIDLVLGQPRVNGLLAGAGYRRSALDLWGNYTFSETTAVAPADEGAPGAAGRRRLGDLARHRANLGLGFPLHRRLGLDLRLNYVGARQVSIPAGPLDVAASWVAHAALTWRDLLPGTDLQLIADNVFDEAYDDPGAINGDGLLFASRFPQPGRTLFVRLLYKLPGASAR